MSDLKGIVLRNAVKWAVVVQVLLVLIWLWPIGLGGKMPVGGDVTQFSIGLMAELGRALRQGRLPIWNALWGFGFPGIGESQMGVYYPPHWIFYGLMPVELGYTVSLVFHTLLGTAGAYWAGRKFGISEVGSAVNGFAWSTCGFFWIHISHQWSYTTAAWMPWALGLAWTSLQGQPKDRSPYWLALVLAIQLLPGHFQIAFITQVSLLFLVIARFFSAPKRWQPVGRTLLGFAWAFPLAGLQLWPTFRLARLAAVSRDFEYLSGFAASPLHLITFLAPKLFEVSPLWRPIVWDPFHTSPEEYLGFVGVVPIFLGLVALIAGIRQRPEVKALALLCLGTLWLALGPYMPGFHWLCQLPGFSFFRGPSRWILATSLGITLLAGVGYDILANGRNMPRLLTAFVFASLALIVGAVSLVELGFQISGDRNSSTSIVYGLYSNGLDSLPWKEKDVLAEALQAAHGPNNDQRVQESWARQGVVLVEAPRPIFAALRLSIYRQEIIGTLAILSAMIFLVFLTDRRQALLAALIAIAVVDLFLNGRPPRTDYGPIASLVDQSPVLKTLSEIKGEPRTIDSLRNLPMVANASPVFAYRTLDLPVLTNLTYTALELPINSEIHIRSVDAASKLGAALRIYDPLESHYIARRTLAPAYLRALPDIKDRNLAGWRYGFDWVDQQDDWAQNFRIATIPGAASNRIGWMLPASLTNLAAVKADWNGNPVEVLKLLETAVPLVSENRSDLSFEVSLPKIPGQKEDEPRLIVLCQLNDPQWTATVDGRPISTFRGFGKKGEGAWTALVASSQREVLLKLRYDGRDIRQGWLISTLALAIWTGALGWSFRSKRES